MQDRHGGDLAESVMLSPAFQTSWVMENLHDKLTLFQTQTLLHLIRGGSCGRKYYRTQSSNFFYDVESPGKRRTSEQARGAN